MARLVNIQLYFDKDHVTLEDIENKLREVTEEGYLDISVTSLETIEEEKA